MGGPITSRAPSATAWASVDSGEHFEIMQRPCHVRGESVNKSKTSIYEASNEDSISRVFTTTAPLSPKKGDFNDD